MGYDDYTYVKGWPINPDQFFLTRTDISKIYEEMLRSEGDHAGIVLKQLDETDKNALIRVEGDTLYFDQLDSDEVASSGLFDVNLDSRSFHLYGDLRMEQNLTAPTSLPSGVASIYPREDGRLYFLSDKMVEHDLTGSLYSRTRSVKSIADCTAAPPTEVDGDRYIVDNTAGTVHADWDGAEKNDVVEFNGLVWAAFPPTQGKVAYVEDVSLDATYIDDGTPEWETRAFGTVNHNDTLLKQGGTTSEYYHMTNSQHTELSDFLTYSAISSSGDIDIAARLDVLKAVTLDDTLDVTGAVGFGSNATIGDNLYVTGSGSFQDYLYMKNAKIKINSGIQEPSLLSVTYSAADRQYTIVNNGTTISVNGVISTPEDQVTTAHADATGEYWLYYTAGSTTATVGSPNISVNAIAGRVYYNTDQGSPKAISFNEKHSQEISAKLHEYQHETAGARFVTIPMGCSMSDYTLNDSTSDTSIRFSLSSGEIYDEDISHVITALSSGSYTVAYRAGSDGSNRADWDDASANPFKMGSTYLNYNQNNGGTWQQTEISTKNFVNYFVFAWTRTDIASDIFLMQGQSLHTTLESAQTEAASDLSMPVIAPEQVPLYKITFKCRSTYTGTTGRCRIVEIEDYRGKISGATVTSGSAVDHQTLSNRTAAGAHSTLTAPLDIDQIFKAGTNDGTTGFSFTDSDGAEIASLDSNGALAVGSTLAVTGTTAFGDEITVTDNSSGINTTIRSYGYNDGSNAYGIIDIGGTAADTEVYTRLSSKLVDGSSGSEDATTTISTIVAGTLTERISFNSGGTNITGNLGVTGAVNSGNYLCKQSADSFGGGFKLQRAATETGTWNFLVGGDEKLYFGYAADGSTFSAAAMNLSAAGALTLNATSFASAASGAANIGVENTSVGSGSQLYMTIYNDNAAISTWDGVSGRKTITLNPNGGAVATGAALTVGTTLAVTGDTINIATQKTPASASATGTKGDIVHDAGYIYVCTATDTWKRAAIATW